MNLDTLLINIPLQPNKRYLFHHQNDCAHSFFIDEIRFVNMDIDIYNFPVPLFLDKIVKPQCCACENNNPDVAVLESQFVYNSSLWCQSCFEQFFYFNGNLIDPDLKFQPFIYSLSFKMWRNT